MVAGQLCPGAARAPAAPRRVAGQLRCPPPARLPTRGPPGAGLRGARRVPVATTAATVAPAVATDSHPVTREAGAERGAPGAGRSRAVVIGAGMAGLATARVLSDHFAEVVILERDHLESGSRKGVPQFQMPHALLKRGLNVAEELFPGFRNDLIAHGAQPVDFLRDVCMFDFGRYTPRLPKHEWSPVADGICATRALYENTLRARTLQIPGISMLSGSWVSDVVLSEGNTSVAGKYQAGTAVGDFSCACVAGVRLKSGEVLDAAVVADTSGRFSGVSESLQRSGYTAPKEERIGAGLGYGARTYEWLPGSHELQNLVLMCSSRPRVGRQGIILPVENNRFQVVLWGPKGDHPPLDDAGYLAYAESLGMPEFMQVLQSATPLSNVNKFTRTENVRRHYDEVDLPGGLIILGDAACAFNPIHGQGMTVGMLSAAALKDHLADCFPAVAQATSQAERAEMLRDVSKQFQLKLAKVQHFPWSVATLDDLQQLASRGEVEQPDKPPMERFGLWYFGMVGRLSAEDYHVTRSLAAVMHMLSPPDTLFSISNCVKVLMLWLRDCTTSASYRPAQRGQPKVAA